jgi:hypothetical protein
LDLNYSAIYYGFIIGLLCVCEHARHRHMSEKEGQKEEEKEQQQLQMSNKVNQWADWTRINGLLTI